MFSRFEQGRGEWLPCCGYIQEHSVQLHVQASFKRSNGSLWVGFNSYSNTLTLLIFLFRFYIFAFHLMIQVRGMKNTQDIFSAMTSNKAVLLSVSLLGWPEGMVTHHTQKSSHNKKPPTLLTGETTGNTAICGASGILHPAPNTVNNCNLPPWQQIYSTNNLWLNLTRPSL